MKSDDLWTLVRQERMRLADQLSALSDDEWRARSLLPGWSVEDVVAHLTAGASLGRLRWLMSMVASRFDDGRHNQRWIEEHRGATPAETLERFRAVVDSTVAPSGHTEAWLGEIVVHGGDVRRPIGIPDGPSPETVEPVARFYARRDFTVPSASLVDGLRLEATDSDFSSGEGPLVTGPTLALTMAMAGRRAFEDDLEGPGLATLSKRSRQG